MVITAALYKTLPGTGLWISRRFLEEKKVSPCHHFEILYSVMYVRLILVFDS